jgi:hypothetical protein
MTVTQRPTQITDDRGRFPNHAYDREPLPDSVVLTNGIHGTAWQRHASDGLWHSTLGGRPKSWESLLRSRNLVLIYDAPVRSAL